MKRNAILLKTLSRRGTFLTQALVLVFLLGLLSSLLVRLALQRNVLAMRSAQAIASRQMTHSLQSVVYTCLQNAQFALPMQCQFSQDEQNCMVAGITMSGLPGPCAADALQVTCGDATQFVRVMMVMPGMPPPCRLMFQVEQP